MVLNLTKLNEIEPYSANFSNLTNSSELINNAIIYSNNSSDGAAFFMACIVLFIFLIGILMALEEPFRLDFLTSGSFAAGVCLIITMTAFLVGIINQYTDLKFWGTIFTLFAIATYIKKQNEG